MLISLLILVYIILKYFHNHSLFTSDRSKTENHKLLTTLIQPGSPVAQDRQFPPRHSAVARGSTIVVRAIEALGVIVLARNEVGMLLGQLFHDAVHGLLALIMTSIVDAAFLLRLALRMRRLSHVPRVGVGAGSLDIVGLLHLGGFIDARDILALVLERLLAGVVADQLQPHFAPGGKFAGFALAHFDAVADLLGDQWWVDALGNFVHGDVTVCSVGGGEVVAVLAGEDFSVHGDGSDEIVLVGWDTDVGAFADCDVLGWGCFFVIFERVHVGEWISWTVGVEVCPDARTGGGVDGGGEEGESEDGIHGCKCKARLRMMKARIFARWSYCRVCSENVVLRAFSLLIYSVNP